MYTATVLCFISIGASVKVGVRCHAYEHTCG